MGWRDGSYSWHRARRSGMESEYQGPGDDNLPARIWFGRNMGSGTHPSGRKYDGLRSPIPVSESKISAMRIDSMGTECRYGARYQMGTYRRMLWRRPVPYRFTDSSYGKRYTRRQRQILEGSFTDETFSRQQQ